MRPCNDEHVAARIRLAPPTQASMGRLSAACAECMAGVRQAIAFALYYMPLAAIWEKLLHVHTKPRWIRIPLRLPLCTHSSQACESNRRHLRHQALPQRNPPPQSSCSAQILLSIVLCTTSHSLNSSCAICAALAIWVVAVAFPYCECSPKHTCANALPDNLFT